MYKRKKGHQRLGAVVTRKIPSKRGGIIHLQDGGATGRGRELDADGSTTGRGRW